jgi:hypothetical protein
MCNQIFNDMGFSERLNQAIAFENEIMEYLNMKSVIAAKNGTEHTHPEFVINIRNNTDSGSKFVRFAPDGILLKNNKTIHWEAKCAKSIEMDAYNTYMKYYEMGCVVVLFVKKKNNNAVYWCYIQDLQFLPIPDDWVTNEYGWLAPKAMNGVKYNGSGTPYKLIDFNSMKVIDDFYKKIPEIEFD